VDIGDFYCVIHAWAASGRGHSPRFLHDAESRPVSSWEVFRGSGLG
jgi:hypothetical protein